MSNSYCGDAVSAFQSAMLEGIGYAPDAIIPDGQLHRFKINGKLTGAYALHVDGRQAGFFQDFRQGVKQNWKASTESKVYSDTERQAFKLRLMEEQKQLQKQEQLKHQQAAVRAKSIWGKSLPAPASHHYLIRKQVKPHNIRVNGNVLVIPIYDRNKELVSLQFIAPDGKKMLLKDGRKKGCFSVIVKSDNGPIGICEGFSTGASCYENFRHQVVVAIDAGNLEAVARTWHDLFPERQIVIYGDNDASGVGQEAAHKAVQAVGGTVLIPPDVGTDWNSHYSNKPQGANL